jgi:hypothetical protein
LVQVSVDKQQQRPPKRKQLNLLDNDDNLLTNFLSNDNLGAMPVAEVTITDLFGKPLFFLLYDWFLEVNVQPLSEPCNTGMLSSLLYTLFTLS